MAQRNARVSLKPGPSRAALTITHPNAAGIDIGAASHFVAVPPDRDDEPVREFPSFTADLNALAECDREIEQQLQSLQVHDGDPAKGKKRGRARNAPKFDLRTQLFRMCGVELTRTDGVDVSTALAVLSEVEIGRELG